ncbi:MAG: peptidylprolyl isomerase [Cyclobacteriaceae bacterium]|nr:peptidylprolyl isomerase [Cyclobacteriaceae bacterium]
MRIYLLLCVFWFSFHAVQGQTKKSTKPLPLFTVGETLLNTDEFLYTYRKNHQKNTDGFTEKNVNEYLDLLVIFKLKVVEARERGLDTTAKFNTEFKTYREELKKPYRTEPDALDKLAKDTYQRLTEEVRVAHILITLKPDALPADTLAAYQKISDLKKRVEAGESFEKLAAEFSEDPSAKYNNGDLGYFTALQMVYPFEEASYETAVGQLSLVRTQFGFHLIKVKDKKPARGEVEVSHILLRTGTPNDEKVKGTIFSIYDQLKGGRNWDEVCREYSEDANTKDAGGRLRPFGVGALPTVPEFEAVAFSLQYAGAISDPFQSGLGWHIIRLEKKIPLPSYKEMEASLKRRVGRDERLQLSQQVLNEKRKKEYGFVEEKSVKQNVFALADSSLLRGVWKYSAPQELAGQKMFSVSGSSFTVRNFLNYVLRNQKTSNLLPSGYMNQLYESFVEEKILSAEEEKLKRENPDFKNLLTEYYEGILLFEIMEKEVWNKASVDSIGQRNYYERNKDTYQAGERIEARIFTAQERSLIDEIKTKISKGDTLKDADLRKFKSIQNFRAFERKDSKIIDKISWSSGLHETEGDGFFYIVEVKRLIPPGLKTFEEARSQVISDYQDYLEKNWVAELRKKYPVKINKKGKKFVLAELTRK